MYFFPHFRLKRFIGLGVGAGANIISRFAVSRIIINVVPPRFAVGQISSVNIIVRLVVSHVSKTLELYWCSAMDMLPRLCDKALGVIIPFVRTYLCESVFSSLLTIKTKSRNCLNPQADMQITIGNKVPCFDKTIARKQE